MIVFLPDLDDEIIHCLILEPNKIELIKIRLTRMPDLIKVRFNPILQPGSKHSNPIY